jgi:hypothetical protein
MAAFFRYNIDQSCFAGDAHARLRSHYILLFHPPPPVAPTVVSGARL